MSATGKYDALIASKSGSPCCPDRSWPARFRNDVTILSVTVIPETADRAPFAIKRDFGGLQFRFLKRRFYFSLRGSDAGSGREEDWHRDETWQRNIQGAQADDRYGLSVSKDVLPQTTFPSFAASHSNQTEVGEEMIPNRNCLLVLLVSLCLSSTPDPSLQNMQGKGEGAQQQAPDFREKIRVRSDLVLLSVTVRDGNGNLVSGLKQGDFHVFDGEVEQGITAFTDEGLPISLVILVDSDTKWKDGTPMAKSLGAIAGGLSVADEAMVCHYDMLFYPGEKFTSVSDNLIDELKATQAAVAPPPPYIPEPVITEAASTSGPPPLAAPTYPGARTTKAMDNALFSAAELLQGRGSDRRRIILIVSDGRNEPKLNRHTHDEVTELLLRDNISVYSLAIGADGPKRRFSMLADYATATGGDIVYARKSSTMENLYSKIAEQARHDYTIAYALTGNLKDSDFHAVRVTVTSGLTASTRRGYYTNDSQALKH
jgi:VWFA-related protein